MAQTEKERDLALFDKWRNGDDAAGSQLFEHHRKALFRFFAVKVGDAVAEDLVQQTFMACVRNRDGFRQEASFKTYLYTAARSKLYDHSAKKKRKPESNLDFTIEELKTSPSMVMARQEELQLLMHAMIRLTPDLKKAIKLYYVQGLRAPQIAEVLDIPVGTVRSRVRRGLEALRGIMEELKADKGLIASTMTYLGNEPDEDGDGDSGS